MNCVTGKRCFVTESLGVEALIQNHIRNDYRKGEGPKNIYECQECGYWHFTSKGAEHEVFSDEEILKRIRTERQGFQWERKMR